MGRPSLVVNTRRLGPSPYFSLPVAAESVESERAGQFDVNRLLGQVGGPDLEAGDRCSGVWLWDQRKPKTVGGKPRLAHPVGDREDAVDLAGGRVDEPELDVGVAAGDRIEAAPV